MLGELSGNLEVVCVLIGCRGFSFSWRGISEAGEALGMFCANRTRSLGSRRAEEQELLVQDVELDLTGPANTSSLHARQGLFSDSAGSIQWGVPLMRSLLCLGAAFPRYLWENSAGEEGSWEFGVTMHGQVSLHIKIVLRSISPNWRTILVNPGPRELGFAGYMGFFLLFSKASGTVRVFLDLSCQGMR